MAETLESIAGLFGFGEKQNTQPSRFAEVVSISGDTVTVTVGASNVDAVRCCSCAVGDVVLVESMPNGTLAAVATKGASGGGGGVQSLTIGTVSGATFTDSGTATNPVLDLTVPHLTCTENHGGKTWAEELGFPGSNTTGWREEKWSDGRLTVWIWDWYNLNSTARSVTQLWPKETTPFTDTPTIIISGPYIGSGSYTATVTYTYKAFTKSTASTDGSIPMIITRSGSTTFGAVHSIRLDGHWN